LGQDLLITGKKLMGRGGAAGDGQVWGRERKGLSATVAIFRSGTKKKSPLLIEETMAEIKNRNRC